MIPSAENGKPKSGSRKDLNFSWILRFAVLCLLASSILCCRQESPSSATKTLEDAPAVVSYPDQPAAPGTKLLFKEDLRIHREGWWPQSVLLDPDGRILISTYRENKIYIYDQSGRESGTMEFPEGQGPGEFFSMEAQLSTNGDLYIYDRLQQRLSIIGLKDEAVKTVMKFGEMRWVFTIAPNGEYYFWIVRFRSGSKDIQDLVLSRFNGSAKLVKEYESYPYAPARSDQKGMRIYGLYAPYGIYKVDPAGNLYVAFSDRYEIRVYSPEGSLLRRIVNKTQPREPNEKDLINIRSYFSEFPKSQTTLIPPTQMPAIADILILSDSSLLVVTFDPSEDEGTLYADWFSPEGRFLSRQKIPKYYLWFKAFGPDRSHAVFVGDHFYAIEPTDETEDDFVVKRYKVQIGNY